MIEFGFYSTQTELNNLLYPLRKMLDFQQLLTFENEGNLKTILNQRYKQTEENLIKHQVKITSCEIIQIIMNIRDDSRATSFLCFFKKYELEVIQAKSIPKKTNILSKKNSDRLQLQLTQSNTILQDSDAVEALDWMKAIDNELQIQIQGDNGNKFVSILFDLQLFETNELNNNAFELLFRNFSSIRNLVTMLQEIQILEDHSIIKTYNTLNELNLSLSNVAEHTENWLGSTDPAKYADGETALHLLDTLSNFLSLTKDDLNGINIQLSKNRTPDEPDQEDLPEQDLLNLNENAQEGMYIEGSLFKTGEGPNVQTQRMVRNLGIQKHIIDILKFDIDNFCKDRESGNREQDTQNQILILKKCYIILAKFCAQNQYNQILLQEYLEDLFLTHARIMPDIGVPLLLEFLFLNNKVILQNPELLQKTIETLVKTVEIIPIGLVYKITYIECMKVMTKYKERIYKINQTIIASEICSKDYSEILLTYSGEQQKEHFKEMIQQFNQSVQHSTGSAPIEIPLELSYFNILLFILGTTTEDKNNATESKCQSYFPLEHLKLLLQTTENCWYIRRNLCYYLYNVYFDTEREFHEQDKIIEDIALKLCSDMKSISLNYNEMDYEFRSYKGMLTMKKIKQEHVINGLIPCFSEIISKRLIRNDQVSKEFNQGVVDGFMKFRDLITPSIYEKETIANFMNILSTHNLIGHHIVQDQISQIERHKKLQKVRPQISGLMEKIQNSVCMSDDDEKSKENQLHNFLQKICENKKYQQYVEEEFNSLVSHYTHIDDNTFKEFHEKYSIDFQEIIQSLIRLIDPKETTLSDDLIKVSLKILRKIIEVENRNNSEEMPPTIAEWETKNYEDSQIQIRDSQNELIEIGVVQILCDLMCSNYDLEIKEEVILVSIALLLGGNRNSQKAFYIYLTTVDRDNKYFFAVKQLIENTFGAVKNIMDLITKKRHDDYMKQNEELIQQNGDQLSSIALDEDEQNQILFLKRLFRMLQLFCEGHNEEMQNLLREQKFNQTKAICSYNFIHMTSVFFGNFIKFTNIECIDLGNQLLDFLIESIQGPCRENQLDLIRSKIIEVCKDLLSKYQKIDDYEKSGFTEETKDQIDTFVTKSIKLLVSLIEGTSNKEIINNLLNILDIDQMINRLAKEYYEMVEKFRKQSRFSHLSNQSALSTVNAHLGSSFENEILEAFDIYILLVTLANESPSVAEKMKGTSSKQMDTTKALEFFKCHTASIEIVFKNDLVHVFFPIQPVCRLLSMNSRDNLMLNVNRDSPNDKISGLVGASPQLFDEMQHCANLKDFWINITQKRFNNMRDLSTLIAMIINFLMLFSYGLEINFYDESASAYQTQIDKTAHGINFLRIIDILGIFQIVTSALMLFSWCIIHFSLIIKQGWRDVQEKQKIFLKQQYDNNNIEFNYDLDVNVDELTYELERDTVLFVKGPYNKNFQKNGSLHFGNFFTRIIYHWMNMLFVFNNSEFKYFLFYLIISISAFSVSEILYCLQLFDIINRFQTLKSVVRAVTYNVKQLVLTFVFGLILIYMNSMIAFYFFYDTFNMNSGENTCTTLFQCFVCVTHFGLRLSGGISDNLLVQSYESDNRSRYYVRFVFDLLFFAFIRVVFLNIIFGIIVDTFAQLRDKKKTTDTDKKNRCYICNIERYQFDRNSDGFLVHIERDHCLWNYLYFIYHIQQKDSTEFNGIESYVSEKIKTDDFTWFPINKAMSLTESSENNEEITEFMKKQSYEIQKKLDIINAKVLNATKM